MGPHGTLAQSMASSMENGLWSNCLKGRDHPVFIRATTDFCTQGPVRLTTSRRRRDSGRAVYSSALLLGLLVERGHRRLLLLSGHRSAQIPKSCPTCRPHPTRPNRGRRGRKLSVCQLQSITSHDIADLTLAADEENFVAAPSSDQVSEEFTWTEEEETIVRRKLDKWIVPLTTFLYLLCFLDRYVLQSSAQEVHQANTQPEPMSEMLAFRAWARN